MRRLVHVVVALGLEEEVACLPRGHAEEPGDQRGHRRIDEQQEVGEQETAGAEKMQRLVDAAVVVVAMVIPPLGCELLEETVHGRPRLSWIMDGDLSTLRACAWPVLLTQS